MPDDSETESYRVWSQSVETEQGQVSVFVGASLESVSETVGVLRRSLLIGVPAILVALASERPSSSAGRCDRWNPSGMRSL